MNPLQIVLFLVVAITLSCCSTKDPCFGGSCRPESVKECVVRVSESLGKHASLDPMVDLDHDGKIGGTDFTLCREGAF